MIISRFGVVWNPTGVPSHHRQVVPAADRRALPGALARFASGNRLVAYLGADYEPSRYAPRESAGRVE
jgi:hypothetical protein